ncbi:MAG: cell envelope integrity protein TolA [Gammaproteobacteria bacterium]|nr:cell envelope integrity protein TolA [Gammaproteobacteria bacterium]
MTPFYLRSLSVSVGLHLGILAMMLISPNTTQAVLQADEMSKVPQEMANASAKQPDTIQAVAVDDQEIEQTMQKLQAERQQKHDAEIAEQKRLANEAQKARIAKQNEMKRLQELQKEAEKMKLAQQKMQKEAQEHLKALEKQKKEQEKQLADLKAKQQAEAKKAKKLSQEKAQAEKKQQQEAVKLAQQKAQEDHLAQQKAESLANQQKMAGEVDRYKALIINAIRDQWILPENVNPDLSSQFVIRLAPTGAVLDVRLTRSSGDELLDRSAQAAIYKASPLPVPTDANAFNMFREISLTVRPGNARG